MNQLEEARVIINEVDKEMASLFEKRMKAVKEVIAYKMENDLPIYDESREKIVIEKNKEYIQDKELVSYYEDFLKYMMKVSKDYQKDIKEEK